jgi:preprotein translocase subunit SecE
MNPNFFIIGGSWLLTISIWAVVIGVAGALIHYRKQIADFTGEVKVELAKASWPWEPKEKGAKKYKELIDSTMIVLIAMLLLSGYVAGWDFIMNLIVHALFRTPAK